MTSLSAPRLSRVEGNIQVCRNSLVLKVPDNILFAASGYQCQLSLDQICFVTFCPLAFRGNVGTAINVSDVTIPFSAMISQYMLISGYVYLKYSPLTSLSLPLLKSVGNAVTIESSSVLTIIAFVNLMSIFGSLSVFNNSFLTSLEMPLLSYIGGSIEVYANAPSLLIVPWAIATTAGIFQSCCIQTSPRGNAGYCSDFFICEQNATKLAQLTTANSVYLYSLDSSFTMLMVPALVSVESSLLIHSNSYVKSVTFAVLERIEDSLSFHRNTQMTSFTLPNLARIGGYLNIDNLSMMLAIKLPVLTSVGNYVYIFGNAKIATIELPSILSVLGVVQITSNARLSSLFLPSLTYIGACSSGFSCNSLFVSFNNALSNITLSNITTVSGNIEICSNAADLKVSRNVYLAGSGWQCAIQDSQQYLTCPTQSSCFVISNSTSTFSTFSSMVSTTVLPSPPVQVPTSSSSSSTGIIVGVVLGVSVVVLILIVILVRRSRQRQKASLAFGDSAIGAGVESSSGTLYLCSESLILSFILLFSF